MNILSMISGIEVIPNRFLQGKTVIMSDKNNIVLGCVDIEKGPFHKDMKKLHVSHEVLENLKEQFGKNE